MNFAVITMPRMSVSIAIIAALILQCCSGLKFAYPDLLSRPQGGDRPGSGSNSGDNSIMTFGRRMEVDVLLPTRDQRLASAFLQKPEYIIQSTFEQDKFQQLTDEKYLIKFLAIPIPGLDVVTPEIELDFVSEQGKVSMRSNGWTLRGQSGDVLKDSKFMQSFDINIVGELYLNNKQAVEAGGPAAPIRANGWVEYRVHGRKPTVFQRAPGFLLDGTINLIQDSAADFVYKRFSVQLLKAFRLYMSSLARQQ